MQFSIVRSSKDEDFDPIQQYSINRNNGVFDEHYDLLLSKASEKENVQQNKVLQREIFDLIKNLKSLDDEWDNTAFREQCIHLAQTFVNTPIINEDSTNLLHKLLDAILSLEESIPLSELADIWGESREDLWNDCLDHIIASPSCPRPILWRLIEDLNAGRDYEYLTFDLGVIPALPWPLCNNWLLGDIAFKEIYNDETVGEIVGALNSFLNPSLSIKSLKIFEPYFKYEYSNELDGKKLLEMFANSFEKQSILLTSISLAEDLDAEIDEDSELPITLAEFTIFISRLFIELKKGKNSLLELAASKNRFLRTFVYHHPESDDFTKSLAGENGVLKIKKEYLYLIPELNKINFQS